MAPGVFVGDAVAVVVDGVAQLGGAGAPGRVVGVAVEAVGLAVAVRVVEHDPSVAVEVGRVQAWVFDDVGIDATVVARASVSRPERTNRRSTRC